MGDYEMMDKEEIYSKVLRAGRRTYFFDVKSTRNNDYYVTITESKRKSEDGSFIKHKIFLYKEDFNKFSQALQETLGHVKSELMPEYDYDEFMDKEEETNNE